MASLVEESTGARCECCIDETVVTGMEFDDGTYVANYDELRVDDGEAFQLELLPDPYGPEFDAWNVFGRGERTLVTMKKLQRWRDEGRLEVFD